MHADAPAADPPPSAWTRRQDKLLEMLAWRWKPNPPWDRVAALLGDKTPAQASDRYARLADELRRLLVVQPVCDTAAPADGDAGGMMVLLPAPTGVEVEASATTGVGDAAGPQASTSGAKARGYGSKLKPRRAPVKRKVGGVRKKPDIWSVQEHSQFLLGLDKYGKGKWITLAREFVKTKTSIQIASHHQKFCNRMKKRELNACKRTSIHDITVPAVLPAEATPAARPSIHNPALPAEVTPAADDAIKSGVLICR
uniref:Myb-like domain-containing protein n=1 Tax=Leersia perrieri TaxID=77586 RepID=A0A0D9VGB1_9ORYZ